jgi:hypothetical protein
MIIDVKDSFEIYCFASSYKLNDAENSAYYPDLTDPQCYFFSLSFLIFMARAAKESPSMISFLTC